MLSNKKHANFTRKFLTIYLDCVDILDGLCDNTCVKLEERTVKETGDVEWHFFRLL